MRINKNYLRKYYHAAAAEQLRDEYRNQGYDVNLEERIGPYRIDMVARKGEETIFFEIKTGDVRAETKRRIKDLSEYIKKEYPKGKFLLLAVRYPDDDTIEIDGIDGILFDYFVSNGTPSDLDELSTHTIIDDILDVTINRIEISHEGIWIDCEGQVSVDMSYGSGKDEESFGMTFPFFLKGTLQYKGDELKLDDVEEFRADTSEFYK